MFCLIAASIADKKATTLENFGKILPLLFSHGFFCKTCHSFFGMTIVALERFFFYSVTKRVSICYFGSQSLNGLNLQLYT